MQQGEAKWENWLTREQAYWNLNLLQMMLNMECCLQFFKIHIVRPLFYARNFPFWLSNYLDQTSIYLWTLTRFPNVCRSADQLFDFSVRGLEKRRSYRNRWTPILLDGKPQQMLWQCLLSPFLLCTSSSITWKRSWKEKLEMDFVTGSFLGLWVI